MILTGTNAVVTGGAARIGRDIALSLARHGVNVCLHYGTSEAEAFETRELIQSFGVKGVMVQGDLRQPASTAADLFQKANRELGAVQVLVNCAAIFHPATLLSTTEANWDDHLTVNLKAPFFLTQEFAKQLPVGRDGAVINMTDWRGEYPIPGHAAYTIAKAGLIAQTKLLAQELGPMIRVNAISPGAILPAPGASEEAFQAQGKKNPLQRVGGTGDIVKAMHYLLSAPFVTGEVLHVTGGQHLNVGTTFITT